MTRQSIAIDIDDVVVAHVNAFLEFSNKNYDTNYTIEDYTDRWDVLWGIDNDAEIKRRALQFHTPESVLSYKFLTNAKTAIKELVKKYDLYIVTARPEYLVSTTEKWVKEHFSGVFQGVHFVPIWELDNKTTKGDICNQIGANYLIDDVVKHCNIAADAGVNAILFGDYAWNRNDETNKNVTRCKNWDEVLKFFLK